MTFLVACSRTGDPVRTDPVKAITVSVSATPIEVGATAQATAVMTDATGATVTGRFPIWSSATPTVARVDQSGLVTALQAGVAIVRATSGIVSGDGQVVVVNPKAASLTISRDTATLFLPGGSVQLLATVRDVRGEVIGNPNIAWVSSAPLIATVSQLGFVTPLAVGATIIRASVDSQVATVAVSVRATPNVNAPAITAIAPSSTLRPGASYTLTGSNFAATTAGNAVVIDGVAAAVTAATPTQLTITVPASGFPCDPTHNVFLQVTAGGFVGGTTASLQVANLRTLRPGQSVVITNLAEVRCNELGDANGRYVVSVYNAARQSITPFAPLVVPLQLRGAMAAVGTAAAPASNVVVAAVAERGRAMGAAPMGGGVAASADAASADGASDAIALRRLRANDAAHVDIMRRNLEVLRAGLPSRRATVAAAPRSAVVAAAVASMGTLGTITQLKAPNLDASNFCASSVPVGARTVYVGQHALILEDTASTFNGAPTLAGQMDSTYAAMGQEFDTVMWPILTGNFGNPLAMDSVLSKTGKIVMLFSPKVNAMQSGTVLGFVVSCDFFPVQQQPSSNVGEYFYAVVPTNPAAGYSPTGDTRKSWLRVMRGTVIHEVKHITSYGERLSRGLPLEEFSWEEGMARQAEELYARAAFYKTQAKADATYAATVYCDIRYTTAGPCLNSPVPSLDRPLLMLRHFDGLYTFAQQDELVSPLGRSYSADQTFYASAWSLERWAADQFGASESQFFKDWTTSSATGVGNFEARTGQPWEQSLGEWSLALYLDNLAGFTPDNSRLRFPSYNLPDLWLGMCTDLGPCASPPAKIQLYPTSNPWLVHSTAFGNFSSSVSLTGGAFALFDISGTTTGRQLLELKQPNGGDPPPPVHLAIVRIR